MWLQRGSRAAPLHPLMCSLWGGRDSVWCSAGCPLTRLQSVSTNSCGICTSLNLIYLRPQWEQRSRPRLGSYIYAPVFTRSQITRCPQMTHFPPRSHGLLTANLSLPSHFPSSSKLFKLYLTSRSGVELRMRWSSVMDFVIGELWMPTRAIAELQRTKISSAILWSRWTVCGQTAATASLVCAHRWRQVHPWVSGCHFLFTSNIKVLQAQDKCLHELNFRFLAVSNHLLCTSFSLKELYGKTSPLDAAVLRCMYTATNWRPAQPQQPPVQRGLEVHWVNKDIMGPSPQNKYTVLQARGCASWCFLYIVFFSAKLHFRLTCQQVMLLLA